MREVLRRSLSLRARMVLLAAAIVTVVLVVAGLALGLGLRASLVRAVSASALVRAQEIAELARQGALPGALPVVDDDEAFVQVIAGAEVLAASANIAAQPPLALPRPPSGEATVYDLGTVAPAEDEGGFRVAALTTPTRAGPVTVYVAASLEDVRDLLERATGLALFGLPFVVAVLAAALWHVVGRTLEPVERIRAEAEAIGGGQLHRRVPEPSREDEVGRLARTLNAMLARLEGSAEQQRRFVADAAHELRSPVASLRAQLETARSAGAVDWDERSGDLLDETVRLQRLIDGLLLLARLDAGGQVLRPRPVDLDDVVVTSARRLPADDVVHVDLSGVEPVQLPGDPALIERLVANLLDNAVRHARSLVRVRAWGERGMAWLEVDDDGGGIPPERRAEVLGRFRRLDDARDRDHGGVGLGLAIVADVARVHAGDVQVGESDLGGASLRVRLPAA